MGIIQAAMRPPALHSETGKNLPCVPEGRSWLPEAITTLPHKQQYPLNTVPFTQGSLHRLPLRQGRVGGRFLTGEEAREWSWERRAHLSPLDSTVALPVCIRITDERSSVGCFTLHLLISSICFYFRLSCFVLSSSTFVSVSVSCPDVIVVTNGNVINIIYGKSGHTSCVTCVMGDSP